MPAHPRANSLLNLMRKELEQSEHRTRRSWLLANGALALSLAGCQQQRKKEPPHSTVAQGKTDWQERAMQEIAPYLAPQEDPTDAVNNPRKNVFIVKIHVESIPCQPAIQ